MRKISVLIMEKEISQYNEWKKFFGNTNVSLEWVYDPGDFVRSIMKKRAMGERFDFIMSGLFFSETVTGIDLWNQYRLDGDLFVLFSGLSMKEIDAIFPGEKPMFLKRPWTSESSGRVIWELVQGVNEGAA